MDEGGDKGGALGYRRRQQRKEDWAKKMHLPSGHGDSESSEEEKQSRSVRRRQTTVVTSKDKDKKKKKEKKQPHLCSEEIIKRKFEELRGVIPYSRQQAERRSYLGEECAKELTTYLGKITNVEKEAALSTK